MSQAQPDYGWWGQCSAWVSLALWAAWVRRHASWNVSITRPWCQLFSSANNTCARKRNRFWFVTWLTERTCTFVCYVKCQRKRRKASLRHYWGDFFKWPVLPTHQSETQTELTLICDTEKYLISQANLYHFFLFHLSNRAFLVTFSLD